MGLVIGLVNTKGGVGKSMLASNIVVALNDQGLRTALIDAEPEAPTAKALNRFDDAIETRHATKLEHIDDAAVELLKTHDVVVVDAPGKTGDAVSTISVIADLVLIPLQTSKRDLRQVRPVIKRIQIIQRKLAGKPIVSLILNFTRKRDVAARIFREQLEPLGIPIARTQIRRLDDYRDNDVVMRDEEGTRDAADDIRSLITETVFPVLNFQVVANE